jgi:hypothetical protein
MLFLLRQHTRTHYIALAFVRGLQDELLGLSKSSENLQAIVLNALEYIKKNFKCLGDIVLAQSVSQNTKSVSTNNSSNTGKHLSKKDLNANPFGVGGGGSTTTRNKENYASSSQNTAKNIAAQAGQNSSKSEKKMFIKQNVQIAIAFLKKICRLSKQF